jgi:hypothetical protein
VRALGTALLLAASGCTAPAFLAHTGRVTPKGSVRAAVGSGYQIATSAGELVDDAKDLANGVSARPCSSDPSRSCYRVEDIRPALRLVRHALVSPFGSYTELSARYGFARRLDAGLHLGTGAKRIDVAWQVHGPADPREDGVAASLVAAYGTRSLSGVGEILRFLSGGADLSDVEVAAVVGRQWRGVAQLYAAGRYVRSDWSLEVLPNLPIDYGGGDVRSALAATGGGTIHHAVAVLGGALGYRQVFVGAELDITHYRGTARILAEPLDLDGFTFMPALYVYGWY